MAMFLVSITTPPFDALYALPPSVPSMPSMLAMLMMLPDRCSSIGRSACLATRNVPVRLTASTRSHSARSTEVHRAAAGDARGVDHRVEAAVVGDDRVDQRGDGRLVGARRACATPSAAATSAPTTTAPSSAKRSAQASADARTPRR